MYILQKIETLESFAISLCEMNISHNETLARESDSCDGSARAGGRFICNCVEIATA
jgi:hypothetical protein